MTTKRIVYQRPDGGVSVNCPAPEHVAELIDGGMTEDEAVAAIQAKNVPSDATNIEVMELSVLAAVGREFRDAWEKPGVGPPAVNIPKARTIHADRIAAAKAIALETLEERETNERLKGNTAAANRASTDRASVVGLNLTALAAQIAGAANPTALSAIWPAALDEFRL